MTKLRLWVLGLVIAAIVVIDVAPTIVQAQDTLVLAQEQPRRRRTLMDLLFGEPEPPPAVQAPVQKQKPRTKRKQKPAATQAAAPPARPAKPAVEKAMDATRIAVFGDSLAVDLAKALERFYAEDPNLVVVPMGVGSSGFVREDFYDWETAVQEQIAANSFDLAVMFIGINDRQEMDVDGKTYKPLSDAWTAEYTARTSNVLSMLRAAGKPIIWVGLPPMPKTEYSTAMSQISAIHRLVSFSGGAEFLDIYDRFADEEGKYTSLGPDLNGQRVSMRKEDGIHLSAAGADKLAFFLSQSIRSFYTSGGGVQVADPLLGTDAQTMLRPPYQGLGQIRQLEVAGAVIPLSRTPPRAGDLLAAQTLPAANPGFELEQLVRAPVGRVDAFGVGIDPAAEEAAR